MATVTTATASVDAEVSYVCSSCATPNTSLVKIQAYAKNPTKASIQLNAILHTLMTAEPAKRYNYANLRCKCAKCGRREPWTKLNFYKLDAHILAWSIICGLSYVTQGLNPVVRAIEHPNMYSMKSAIIHSLIMLIMLLPPVLIFVHKKIKAATSAKKIAALPAESLPRIRILQSPAPSSDAIMARVYENLNKH